MPLVVTREFKRRVAELDDDPDALEEIWRHYYQARTGRTYVFSGDVRDHGKKFVNVVNKVLGHESCFFCPGCSVPQWVDNSVTDVDDIRVCDYCRDEMSECIQCSKFSVNAGFLTWIDDEPFCETCRDSCCAYCNSCGEWYQDLYSDDHNHDEFCKCDPQELNFQIPANSHGILKQDERLLVEFPSGFITDEAIRAAVDMLWARQLNMDIYHNRIQHIYYGDIWREVAAMDREWQTKRGNFTRRLSALLYNKFHIKLNPGMLSDVGSTVRDHTGTKRTQWYVEFTRDLNQPASAFWHTESCWWQSENSSLCALKHWGGLGMRAYDSEEQERDMPSGRVWVQPLGEDLQPTQNTLNPRAYVVYNGYGSLEGYSAARILAYLTSLTYKKIALDIDYQYVNGDGYLIGDQETCDKTSSIYISGTSQHAKVVA